MKKQNIIIIIVFGALIFGLGLLGWLTPDQAFSENENRYLQELPKLSEDTMVNGDFGDEVEDYLSDQFWLDRRPQQNENAAAQQGYRRGVPV